jgi:hypothetical protein
MVCQFDGHSRRTLKSALVPVIDLKAQGFDTVRQIVNDIFPDTRGAQHLNLFRKAQCFAH